METESAQNELLITLTSDIVAAHVSNNSVAVSDVSSLIQNVHAALSALNQPVEAPEVRPEPAVSIRAAITSAAANPSSSPLRSFMGTPCAARLASQSGNRSGVNALHQ